MFQWMKKVKKKIFENTRNWAMRLCYFFTPVITLNNRRQFFNGTQGISVGAFALRGTEIYFSYKRFSIRRLG